MTKAANHALASILVLGLVAIAGDAFAKPGQTQKQAKPRTAKRVQVAKAKAKADAKADAAAVVSAVAAETAKTAVKTAAPPSPDALLAGLAPAVKAAPAAASVDALVAKACALGDKPVAKPTASAKAKARAGRLAYMRGVTSRATALDFAPIAREGERPTGDHMVIRMEDRPLPQGVVRRVVRANRRDVTACHEAAAVHGKAPRGNVVLRFAVDAAGKVTRASVVAAGANHKGFERCLEGRVRGWKFPKGETETKVEYPLTLQ